MLRTPTPTWGLICVRCFTQARTKQKQQRSTLDRLLLQPALFVIEYALAKLWMHWGVRPQ